MSKDAELTRKSPHTWASIKEQVHSDVTRLHSISGARDVEYIQSPPDGFTLKRTAAYPTITLVVRFPDPHFIEFECKTKKSSDAIDEPPEHGLVTFKLDRDGNVLMFYRGERIEDEGDVSELFLGRFLPDLLSIR